METGDWVISILIGGFGILGIIGLIELEKVGRAIMSSAEVFGEDLKEVTDSIERIEQLLLDIRQEVVTSGD